MADIIEFKPKNDARIKHMSPLSSRESTDETYQDFLWNTVKFTYGDITIARTGVSRLGPTYDPAIIDSPDFNEELFTKILKYVDSIRLPKWYSEFTVTLQFGDRRKLYSSADIFRFLDENPTVDFHLHLHSTPTGRAAIICANTDRINLDVVGEYNREDFEDPIIPETENVLVLPLPRIRVKDKLTRLRPIEDIRYEREEKKREANKAWDPYWDRDPPEWTRIEHGDL